MFFGRGAAFQPLPHSRVEDAAPFRLRLENDDQKSESCFQMVGGQQKMTQSGRGDGLQLLQEEGDAGGLVDSKPGWSSTTFEVTFGGDFL